MEITTSNLYAEKVYSEHPIALYPLDEKIDYISLILDSNRNISGWTLVNATCSSATSDQSWPVSPLGLVTSKLLFSSTSASVQSQNLSISNNLGSLSVGAYFYTEKPVNIQININYISQGQSVTSSSDVFNITETYRWLFISQLFKDLPKDIPNFSISFSFSSTISNSSIHISGITAGQKAEQFNTESLGVSVTQLSDIYTTGSGVGISKYGEKEVYGYCLADDGILAATNFGVPMAFGSYNSTIIIPRITEGEPSLIIPGEKFFNIDGLFKQLTLEFWIKIQAFAVNPRRIVGPVSSNDGIYVHDNFISLKVGSNTGTYFIREWDRPMLMAITISHDLATLIINGETVIRLEILSDSIVLPQSTKNNKDQDWIGFYAYSDVPVIEIDCIGIYPYVVPNVVEKRRWVYGQGVDSKIGSYGVGSSETVSIDYSVSKYPKNYIYPDIGKWQQGIKENLVISNNQIENPKYDLPDIVFSNKTTKAWEFDNEAANFLDSPFDSNYISLKPNYTWTNTAGYVLFKTLKPIDQDVRAFYIVFSPNKINANKEILFKLKDETSQNSFTVYAKNNADISSTTISYSFIYNNVESLFDTAYILEPGDVVSFGIDIPRIIKSNVFSSDKLTSFFANKKNIQLYLGGSSDLNYQETFSGKFYSVGFSTERNYEKISQFFNLNGIHFESTTRSNEYLDGGSPNDSKWNHTVDSQVIDASNLNSNIDYLYDASGSEEIYFEPKDAGDGPSLTTSWGETLDAGNTIFSNVETLFDFFFDGGAFFGSNVQILASHVASYTLMPKMFLNNLSLQIFSNGYWQDHVPLSYFTKKIDTGVLDLDFLQFNIGYSNIAKYMNLSIGEDKQVVKTYVSFQHTRDLPKILPSSYTVDTSSILTGVLNVGQDWENIKYQITDDTIIYPPNEDFNSISIVLHIETESGGPIINPFKIRNLELSAQVLNQNSETSIGTKYHVDIYPYNKTSSKNKNPYTIYKRSTPQMYLTSNSGVALKNFNTTDNRGISLKINKSLESVYKINSLQMSIKWQDYNFMEKDLFEIKTIDSNSVEHSKLKISIKPDTNTKRGILSATGDLSSGISFYINGNLCYTPVIDSNTWSVLSIVFNPFADFSGISGQLNIIGPILVNNISYVQIPSAYNVKEYVYNKWGQIFDQTNENWAYWTTAGTGINTGTWNNVLILSDAKDKNILTGKDMFEIYTGTNSSVVGDGSTLKIESDKYTFYTDVSWTTNITQAV
jgi:hypothetical protein